MTENLACGIFVLVSDAQCHQPADKETSGRNVNSQVSRRGPEKTKAMCVGRKMDAVINREAFVEAKSDSSVKFENITNT